MGSRTAVNAQDDMLGGFFSSRLDVKPAGHGETVQIGDGDYIFATPLFSYPFRFCLDGYPLNYPTPVGH